MYMCMKFIPHKKVIFQCVSAFSAPVLSVLQCFQCSGAFSATVFSVQGNFIAEVIKVTQYCGGFLLKVILYSKEYILSTRFSLFTQRLTFSNKINLMLKGCMYVFSAFLVPDILLIQFKSEFHVQC